MRLLNIEYGWSPTLSTMYETIGEDYDMSRTVFHGIEHKARDYMAPLLNSLVKSENLGDSNVSG